MGLAAIDQPWVDWVGGQKEEKQGQDEETGVEINKARAEGPGRTLGPHWVSL